MFSGLDSAPFRKSFAKIHRDFDRNTVDFFYAGKLLETGFRGISKTRRILAVTLVWVHPGDAEQNKKARKVER